MLEPENHRIKDKDKSVGANLAAAAIVYLSLIYLWLLVRTFGAADKMFESLGGPPAPGHLLRAAGRLADQHALLSWAAVSALFLLGLTLVVFFRRRRNLGLVSFRGVIVILLTAWAAAYLGGAIMYIVAYRPMSQIITNIK